MRRRALLGGSSSVEYVFSAQSTYVTISYSSGSLSLSIKSTANGSNIGYSVVSYDGTVITSVTTGATSFIIYWSANPTYNYKSGSVVLKQNDSNKTITINASQYARPLSLGYDAILLDGNSGSNGSISFDSSVSFSNVPDWANVTYSSGKINVTASSTNSSSTARYSYIHVYAGSSSSGLTIIQLPSDYHSRDYVTIGSKNWAIKNVGASSVQDYGNYYMYGKGARVYNSSDSSYEGTEDPLDSSVDTATQVMGSGWRMPTNSECYTLTTTAYYWVSYNGVNGGVFYSSGNVLFLPAAGVYMSGNLFDKRSNGYVWSSTPSGISYGIRFIFSRGNRTRGNFLRAHGCSVRGVHD